MAEQNTKGAIFQMESKTDDQHSFQEIIRELEATEYSLRSKGRPREAVQWRNAAGAWNNVSVIYQRAIEIEKNVRSNQEKTAEIIVKTGKAEAKATRAEMCTIEIKEDVIQAEEIAKEITKDLHEIEKAIAMEAKIPSAKEQQTVGEKIKTMHDIEKYAEEIKVETWVFESVVRPLKNKLEIINGIIQLQKLTLDALKVTAESFRYALHALKRTGEALEKVMVKQALAAKTWRQAAEIMKHEAEVRLSDLKANDARAESEMEQQSNKRKMLLDKAQLLTQKAKAYAAIANGLARESYRLVTEAELKNKEAKRLRAEMKKEQAINKSLLQKEAALFSLTKDSDLNALIKTMVLKEPTTDPIHGERQIRKEVDFS